MAVFTDGILDISFKAFSSCEDNFLVSVITIPLVWCQITLFYF